MKEKKKQNNGYFYFVELATEYLKIKRIRTS